jgi:hypothetical protein
MSMVVKLKVVYHPGREAPYMKRHLSYLVRTGKGEDGGPGGLKRQRSPTWSTGRYLKSCMISMDYTHERAMVYVHDEGDQMALLLSLWLAMVPWLQAPHWPLSLTPIRPANIVVEDVRLVCPKSTHPVMLRQAPLPCVVEAIQADIAHMQRILQRWQRELERQQRMR